MASREVTYTVNPTRVDLSGFTKANKAVASIGKSAIGASKKVVASFGRMTKSAGKFAIKSTKFLAVASAAAIGVSIKMAASAEEVENKFVVSFANMSNAANDWINTYSSAVGRSRFETKLMLSDTQDLLTGFGATTEQAFQLSKQIQEAGVDLASFNNLQDLDAVTRFRKGLLGEHENFKALGIIVNQTVLQQEAYDQGINKTLKDIDDLTKIQLRYSIALRQSKNATGDARRSFSSLTNQSKGLVSGIKDTATAFGSIFIPQATSVVTFLNTKFADAFIFVSEKLKTPLTGLLDSMSLLGRLIFFMADQVKNAFDIDEESFGGRILNSLLSVTEGVENFTNFLFENKNGVINFFISVISGASSFVSAILQKMKPLIGFFLDLKDMFLKEFGPGSLDMVFSIIKSLGKIFISVIKVLGAAIKAIFPTFLKLLKIVIKVLDGILKAANDILGPLTSLFKAIFENDIPGFMKAGKDLIIGVVIGIARIFATFLGVIFDLGVSMSEGFSKIIDSIIVILKKIIEPIIKVINKVKELIKLLSDNKVLGFLSDSNAVAPGSTFGISGFDIPGFANGVSNFGGGLAVVGEKGPEMINLSRGSSVTSNSDTMKMLREKLHDINVNINIHMKGSSASPKEFVDKIKQPLRSEIEKIFRSLISEMGL